jgi:hypothetical protein
MATTILPKVCVWCSICHTACNACGAHALVLKPGSSQLLRSMRHVLQQAHLGLTGSFKVQHARLASTMLWEFLTFVCLSAAYRALPLTGVMARTRAMAVAEAKAQAARSRDISIRMHQEMQGGQPATPLPV